MHVTLFLTHQCNLRCDYCYNGTLKRPGAMAPEIARRGVELALTSVAADPAEPVLIRFFGGEPLLELALLHNTVAHARAWALRQGKSAPLFSVTTNGTLLDRKTAKLLEREGFTVAVSLDGCRQAHDAHRRFADGASSYRAAREGLHIALAELRSVESCSVIQPDTALLLAPSLDELLSLGVPTMTFALDYEARWTEAHLSALEVALEQFADRLVGSYRSGQSPNVEPFDTKIRSHIGGGFPSQCRCPFGQGELAVAPSGRLYPCERLVREDDREELCIGSVFNGPDMAKVALLRGRLDEPATDCEHCQLAARCMHWCGCVNVMTSGVIGTPSPTVCRLEQLLIRSADRVAAVLYAESNPTFIDKFYGTSCQKCAGGAFVVRLAAGVADDQHIK